MIKGRMFERLVELHENADGDEWRATLHDDPSYPGSDIVFTSDGGERIEVSLKTTDSADYIEEALRRYPDIPILTTENLGPEFEDLDVEMASGFSNEHLTEVTEENFDRLLEGVGDTDAGELGGAVGVGTAADAAASLWPFVVAYMRGRIGAERLQQACVKVLPEAGGRLATRLMLMAILGPIYAWYLLARSAMQYTPQPAQGPRASARCLIHESPRSRR
jgi:hypothetical protein